MEEEMVEVEFVVPASAGPYDERKYCDSWGCYIHDAIMRRLPHLHANNVEVGAMSVEFYGYGIRYELSKGYAEDVRESLDAGRDHVVTVTMPKRILLAGK